MAQRTIIEKGTTVKVTNTYTDAVAGTPLDPSAVTCKVRKPDGTITQPLALNPAVGTWAVNVATDQEGTWYARFYATNPNRVDTFAFDVRLDPDF